MSRHRPHPARPAHPRPAHRARPDERGAVTAELAVALPTLLAVTAGLLWMLSVAIAQIRTVDAARETARALARGDDQAAALAVGDRVAPSGVRISVDRTAGRVVVHAAGRMAGPGGLFAALPGADLTADAVALVEVPSASGATVTAGGAS